MKTMVSGGSPSRDLAFRWGVLQATTQLLGRRRGGKLLQQERLDLLGRFLDEARRGGEREPTPVPRRRGLSLQEFRTRYQKPGIPVVLEGAALDWPCTQTWTVARLKQDCADDLLPIDHDFGRLGPLLDEIESGSERYLRFYSLVQRHPEFLRDLDMRYLTERRNPGLSIDQGFQTFIGNAQARPTALHSANDGNLFVQVVGKKRWRFYPNSHSFAVDPPPVRGEYRSQRFDQPQFDPFSPDYNRFPIFKYVPSWETILEPGDVLWNPPYVWHAVKNLTNPTIAIGYRWLNPAQCFRLAPLYASLDCLATKPPIWRSVRLADKDFSLVFLEQFPSLKSHPRFPEYLRQVRASYDAYREERKRLTLDP